MVATQLLSQMNAQDGSIESAENELRLPLEIDVVSSGMRCHIGDMPESLTIACKFYADVSNLMTATSTATAASSIFMKLVSCLKYVLLFTLAFHSHDAFTALFALSHCAHSHCTLTARLLCPYCTLTVLSVHSHCFCNVLSLHLNNIRFEPQTR